AELDLKAPRQLQAELAFKQIRNTALARLAVNANHGLVAATEVFRIDGQIRHVPYLALLASRKSLFDGVLVRARKRGVNQVAPIRVARVHRQLVAVLDGMADFVDFR